MAAKANTRGKGGKRSAKQARALATVDTILTGAALVLERHGYASATTDRIAERAGVSVGSIYQYFANKDAVFEQLFARETGSLMTTLRAILDTPLSNGHELIRAYLEAGATQEYLTPTIYEELGRVASLDKQLIEFSDALVELTMALIDRARPGLSASTLRVLAELLVATAQGIGNPLRRGPNEPLLNAYVEMIDMYVLGARAEQSVKM